VNGRSPYAVAFVVLCLGTIALALGWAILMPVLILLARRFDGVH